MSAEQEAVVETTKTVHKPKDDFLVQISSEIEKLTAEEALSAIPDLMNETDSNYFRLGGILSVVNANKYYEKDGYENFRSFCETKLGIPYRKSMYWIHIYEALIESGISWNKVKDVGWTKLKDLASILNVDNVDEWVQRALTSTVHQLQELIKKSQAGTLANSGIEPTDDAPDAGTKSTVTTITFKVHADQKTLIEEAVVKAKSEAKTEHSGVALESICMNYLSGGKASKQLSLADVMANHTPENVLTAFGIAYPEFHVTASIKKAQKTA